MQNQETKFKVGQKVSYSFYGVEETATVIRVGGGVLFLDNGRWMHFVSCKVAKTPVGTR